ncbi:DNA ligase [uncultured Caudovirales phage]|uniref:DNA ligase n=1 Tax=uncultured Caudovirales phage TaxID=2100421 RepID=A0A6J5MAC8_9CAUD|nr:DNA ligase [uncultured Caudovirales phage]
MLTLYKIGNASKALLPWTIWRDGTSVYTEWTPPKAIEPQVAVAQFESVESADQHYRTAITKKRRLGYSEEVSDSSPKLLPMLANKYNPESSTSRKFPYFVQPKYDGQRCIYDAPNKRLLSRTGQMILSLPSLLERLVLFQYPSLDGELYCHGKSLQQILSSTRQTVNIVDDESIKYMVYDLPVPDIKQRDRIQLLKTLANHTEKRILISEYSIVYSHEEVLQMHSTYVDRGYEGVMLRHPDGLYRFGPRTSDLLKFKTELDDYFPIHSIKKDKVGNPIFSLRSPNGLFNAVIEGDDAYRKQLYEQRSSLIGMQVKVHYIGLSDIGIPRHARIVSLSEE